MPKIKIRLIQMISIDRIGLCCYDISINRFGLYRESSMRIVTIQDQEMR